MRKNGLGEKLKKLRIRVSGNSLKDILKTKNLAKDREEIIAAAQESTADGTYAINRKARHLHPDELRLVIRQVTEPAGSDTKIYRLSLPDGGPLPAFRAGQYLSFRLRIGQSDLTRPYAICSSPREAEEGFYAVAVQRVPGGFASEWILQNWKEGDEVLSSGPDGSFYHEKLRDTENVLALAGGSGITPFVSMARAIAEGTESFDLTILYGARDLGHLLFREELDGIAAACGRVRTVYVLEKEERDGFAHGYLTEDLIRRHLTSPDEGVYFCGPRAMKKAVLPMLAALGVPPTRIRTEGSAIREDVTQRPDYPRAGDLPASFPVTVRQGLAETEIGARPDEPLLVSLERAGIRAPSRCRAGECGWCRARLLSGEVFVPPECESRRQADRDTGHIHVCCAFPLSPITLEIPPM